MIIERKKVYSLLSNYNKKLSKEGFVYTFDIPVNHIEKLKISSFDYINCSLLENYNSKFNISTEKDILENIDKILEMPNITPNGKFLPKNETAKYLNAVQKSLIDYLDSIGLSENIEKMQTVNIWIKSFNQSGKFSQRPMYTGRIHSDAWVGHHGDSILWLSPIMSNKNTMEVLEPLNPSDDFLSVSKTFEEARGRYSGTKLIGRVKYGKMAIMDHLSLHRTVYEKKSFPRITLSCGVTIKSENSLEKKSDKVFRNEFDSSYYPIEELRKIGKDSTFFVKETLEECKIKFKNMDLDYKILPNNGVLIIEENNK